MARCPSQDWDRNIREQDASAEAEEKGILPPEVFCIQHRERYDPQYGCVSCMTEDLARDQALAGEARKKGEL